MRPTAAAVAVSCLAFLTAGAGDRFRITLKEPEASPALVARLWAWGATAFEAGRYEEAAAAFTVAARQAGRLGRKDFQAQCLNNVGAAWLAAFQFRDAIQAYLEARDLAERAGDWQTAAVVSGNVATLYAQTGELRTASAESERALRLARRASLQDPQLLLRAASLRALQGDLDAALPLFDEAARVADLRGNIAVLTQIWRLTAHEYLRAGRLAEAETAALEAYRLHRLMGVADPYLVYRALALIHGVKGDLAAAERFMDLALESAARASLRLPPWSLYYERGKLRARRHKYEEAMADLRRAADLARRWRLEALPAEALAVPVDATLHQLYAALAETAATLAIRRNSPALAREALEAAEENRAASLRARLEAGEGRSPPPAYGELLRELHSLELAQATDGRAARPARLAELRRKLVELEIREGLRSEAATSFRWERGAPLLTRLQRSLGKDEAYLALQVGPGGSYRWSVTDRQLRLDVLAPHADIARAASSFTDQVWQNPRGSLEAGVQLYRYLFGGLSPEVLGKRTWFLGLDADLFLVPFAALPVEKRGDCTTYLVEQRVIQIVPGADVLRPVQKGSWSGLFLGVADAVYNRADARWAAYVAEVRGDRGRWLLPRARAGSPLLELPRLPGTSREVRACALAWGKPSLVLEGPKAAGETLRAALANRPTVLHFAGHVVSTDAEHERISIALSLDPDGKPELMGPEVIRGLRPAPRLVVLSGCRSARAAVLPGAGLLGLTRAWLLAGSRAVVASLWPVPDDEGELFSSFYRHLGALGGYGSRAPAFALQQAQVEMLSRKDWRARPDYWAGYVLIGVP